MTQPTYTAIRQAIADTLSSAIPGLRGTTNPLRPNLPCAIVVPVQGSFASYSQTMDGAVTYRADVIVAVSNADGDSGFADLDSYISTTGANSIWAAIQANQSLGIGVSYAVVTEATGHALQNFSGVDALASHFIIEVGV